MPTRGIYSQADLKAFRQSQVCRSLTDKRLTKAWLTRACHVFGQTYADFMIFVRLLNERVRGVAVSDAYPVGPVRSTTMAGLIM